jgi:hypothetical protein
MSKQVNSQREIYMERERERESISDQKKPAAMGTCNNSPAVTKFCNNGKW